MGSFHLIFIATLVSSTVRLGCMYKFVRDTQSNNRIAKRSPGTHYKLDTNILFGLPDNILHDERRQIHTRIKEVEADLHCELYTNAARLVYIDRHGAQARTIGKQGTYHGNDRSLAKRDVSINRQGQLPSATAGQCMMVGSAPSNSLELKCKIMYFFDNRQDISVTKGVLKWAHIGRTLKEHVSPLLETCGENTTVASVYEDLTCVIKHTNISPYNSNRESMIRTGWGNHMEVLQYIHQRLIEVQSNQSKDGIKCFDEMMDILKDLTEVQQEVSEKKNTRWTKYDDLWDSISYMFDDSFDETIRGKVSSTKRSDRSKCIPVALIKLRMMYGKINSSDSVKEANSPIKELLHHYKPLCVVLVKFFNIYNTHTKVPKIDTLEKLCRPPGLKSPNEEFRNAAQWRTFFENKKRRLKAK